MIKIASGLLKIDWGRGDFDSWRSPLQTHFPFVGITRRMELRDPTPLSLQIGGFMRSSGGRAASKRFLLAFCAQFLSESGASGRGRGQRRLRCALRVSPK